MEDIQEILDLIKDEANLLDIAAAIHRYGEKRHDQGLNKGYGEGVGYEFNFDS